MESLKELSTIFEMLDENTYNGYAEAATGCAESKFYEEEPLCNVYLFFLDNPVTDGSLGAVIVDSHFYQSLAFS